MSMRFLFKRSFWRHFKVPRILYIFVSKHSINNKLWNCQDSSYTWPVVRSPPHAQDIGWCMTADVWVDINRIASWHHRSRDNKPSMGWRAQNRSSITTQEDGRGSTSKDEARRVINCIPAVNSTLRNRRKLQSQARGNDVIDYALAST